MISIKRIPLVPSVGKRVMMDNSHSTVIISEEQGTIEDYEYLFSGGTVLHIDSHAPFLVDETCRNGAHKRHVVMQNLATGKIHPLYTKTWMPGENTLIGGSALISITGVEQLIQSYVNHVKQLYIDLLARRLYNEEVYEELGSTILQTADDISRIYNSMGESKTYSSLRINDLDIQKELNAAKGMTKGYIPFTRALYEDILYEKFLKGIALSTEGSLFQRDAFTSGEVNEKKLHFLKSDVDENAVGEEALKKTLNECNDILLDTNVKVADLYDHLQTYSGKRFSIQVQRKNNTSFKNIASLPKYIDDTFEVVSAFQENVLVDFWVKKLLNILFIMLLEKKVDLNELVRMNLCFEDEVFTMQCTNVHDKVLGFVLNMAYASEVASNLSFS